MVHRVCAGMHFLRKGRRRTFSWIGCFYKEEKKYVELHNTRAIRNFGGKLPKGLTCRRYNIEEKRNITFDTMLYIEPQVKKNKPTCVIAFVLFSTLFTKPVL